MPAQRDNEENVATEASPADRVNAPDGRDIDLSLLKDSLANAPWERERANDEALNFAEPCAWQWRIEMQNLGELTRRLFSSQAEFVLIGGFAAVAHGVTLVTRDVDI